MLSRSIYNSTISELQHFVMPLASIEDGKLACAHTQNRTLFKVLGFRRSGHKNSTVKKSISCGIACGIEAGTGLRKDSFLTV